MKIRVSDYVAKKMKRSKTDFILAFFRCSGAGGQAVNKQNTGVRITDKITGIACEGKEERSQLQNRNAAFERLARKLIEHYQAEELANKVDYRVNQVVRSYDKCANRVKDHRTDLEYDYKTIINGKLEEITKDLLIDEFSKSLAADENDS